MKRILVLSDTHGNTRLTGEAVRRSRPLDGVIHLGDLVQDAYEIRKTYGLTLWTVAGNNDRYLDVPRQIVLTLEGVRLFVCHGDLYDFHPHHPRREWKRSMARMLREAAEKGAQCVLFGHTHRPYCRRHGNMLVMNPGSLWEGERRTGFGLLRIRGARVKGSLCTLDPQGALRRISSMLVKTYPFG